MDFSEISIQPIISRPLMEMTYIVHRKDSSDCLIVDPGLEPDKILERIDTYKLNPVAILVTHGHYDHIAGIGALKEIWRGCAIYVSEAEKEKLTDPEQNLSSSFGFDMTTPAADATLQDGDQLEVAGIPIEVRHTPGHSSGHVVYLIPAEPQPILFSGDVIFEQSIGRSDFPGGSHAQLLQSIQERILTLPDDTVIYPGHGAATTVGREKKYNPFLSSK